ncbi:MAG: peptidoglycan-binding protein [Burkholderiales bacterium]|nr:peptidoglycan-binding protein [Burkholderiales bacterium]
MAGFHTVQQGDTLAKIAADNGFFDFHTIWDHAKNADLRARRDNPNVLAPGDQVFIPDKDQRTEAKATDATHRFQVRRTKNLLRLVLEDLYGKPIANATCELTVEGQVFTVVTGGDGKFEREIPAGARSASVLVKKGQTPLLNVPLQLEIGHLDPVDQRSGQIARLSNLGYFLGGLDDEDERQFKSAVEEFQCDQKLKVDGDCGPNTQAKLLSVHGC